MQESTVRPKLVNKFKIGRRSNKLPQLMRIGSIVVAWRLGLQAVAWCVAPHIRPSGKYAGYYLSNLGAKYGFERWLHWDGQWYASIVQTGYHSQAVVFDQRNVAFFPGFPFLIRMIHDITRIPYAYTGMIINLLVTIGIAYVAYLLYSTWSARYRPGQPDRDIYKYLPVAFILAFPTAFFFAAFYAEALLVFCLMTSLYLGLARRYWLAAVFAGIAAACKVSGLIGAPTLAVLFLEQKGVFTSGLWAAIKSHGLRFVGLIALSLSGLLAYMTYLGIRFSDPLIFYTANQAWGRKLGGFFLGNALSGYAHIFEGSPLNYLVNLSVAAVPVIALTILAYALYEKVWWMAVYTFLMIVLPLSTGTLLSVNRLALILAPCAVYFLAVLPRRLYRYGWLLICLMAVTEAILAAYFLQGSYFIAYIDPLNSMVVNLQNYGPYQLAHPHFTEPSNQRILAG